MTETKAARRKRMIERIEVIEEQKAKARREEEARIEVQREHAVDSANAPDGAFTPSITTAAGYLARAVAIRGLEIYVALKRAVAR